jgi:hypothetical protein
MTEIAKCEGNLCKEWTIGRGKWVAIGLTERDNGQILDCCVDDQSFARRVGILG